MRQPLDVPRPATTFVVRSTVSLAGELAGNVQRVRTGERRAFHRTEAIGALIAEMLASGETHGGGDMPVKRADRGRRAPAAVVRSFEHADPQSRQKISHHAQGCNMRVIRHARPPV